MSVTDDTLIATLRNRIEQVPGCRFVAVDSTATSAGVPGWIQASGRGPSMHRCMYTWEYEVSTHPSVESVLSQVDHFADVQQRRLKRANELGVGNGLDIAVRGECAHLSVDRIAHRLLIQKQIEQGHAPTLVLERYRASLANLVDQNPGFEDVLSSPAGRIAEKTNHQAFNVPVTLGSGAFDGERIRIPLSMSEAMLVEMQGRKVAEAVDIGPGLSELAERTIIAGRSNNGWTTLDVEGDWVLLREILPNA